MAVELLHAQELAEPIALETLAATVHIRPNHLIRLFRKNLQSTPQQFWDRLRIEHAQSRLRQPDIRIKEVSIDLGFKHLSHFYKWFKRHTAPPAIGAEVIPQGGWNITIQTLATD